MQIRGWAIIIANTHFHPPHSRKFTICDGSKYWKVLYTGINAIFREAANKNKALF